jgi:hypothetical protein
MRTRRTDAGLFDDGAPGGGDAAPEETNFFKRCLLVDGDHRDVRHDGVLREGGCAHLQVRVQFKDAMYK